MSASKAVAALAIAHVVALVAANAFAASDDESSELPQRELAPAKPSSQGPLLATTAPAETLAPPSAFASLGTPAPTTDGDTAPVKPTRTSPTRRVALFVNPAEMLFGTYGGEVDFRIASFASLNVGAAYLSQGNVVGGGGSLGVQFFVTGEAFHGIYLYPEVSFGVATLSGSDASATGLALGAGGTAGYQWNWDFGLAFRMGGGAQYTTAIAVASGSGRTASSSSSGVSPLIDLAVGWSF